MSADGFDSLSTMPAMPPQPKARDIGAYHDEHPEMTMAEARKNVMDMWADECFGLLLRFYELYRLEMPDAEYEQKMDALLCSLTNGKWSKTRKYSLGFMESCIRDEFEDASEQNTCTNVVARVDSETFGCSECGMYMYDPDIGRTYTDDDGKRWYGTSNSHHINFCPNCGARVEKR